MSDIPNVHGHMLHLDGIASPFLREPIQWVACYLCKKQLTPVPTDWDDVRRWFNEQDCADDESAK